LPGATGNAAEGRLDALVARSRAPRERADREVVDAEEDSLDDGLPVDRPVDRLAHRAIVRGRLGDVHAEAERVAGARRKHEGEALVLLEARVVGLGDLVDEQVLAALERRDARGGLGDRAELDLIEVGPRAVLEELRAPG